MTKKRRDFEEYEEYWKFTAAFTDIHGQNFIMSLRIIQRFIDNHSLKLKQADKEQFSSLYEKLQAELIYNFGYDTKDPGANVRKIINQFVKMGFIEPFLKGYDHRVVDFLKAQDDIEKQNYYFSQIFYEKSSLMSTTTNDQRLNANHIQFLLNTIANLPDGYLFDLSDLTALMLINVNLSKYKNKNYVSLEELEDMKRYAKSIDFADRKYNQVNHLFSMLSCFPDLVCNKRNGTIQLKNDPNIVLKDKISTVRDPYRYNLFKGALVLESNKFYDKKVCYLTKRPQKGLVASHIVGSAACIRDGHVDDAYNVNNGLLLSPNIDAYFDKGDITFDQNGCIIARPDMSYDEIQQLRGLNLDKSILNEERLYFMEINRSAFHSKYGEGIKIC